MSPVAPGLNSLMNVCCFYMSPIPLWAPVDQLLDTGPAHFTMMRLLVILCLVHKATADPHRPRMNYPERVE